MCILTSHFYSWGLSYNMLGDKLLGLNLFPASVYEMRRYRFIFIS